MKDKIRHLQKIDLLETYSLNVKKKDKELIWPYYVTRRISFWITPLFLKLRISANQVSFLAIITGIISAILIMVGNYWMVLSGAILMQIWLTFDALDGNIARYKKNFSSFGKFLEELEGAIIAALFFSSVGVSASKFPGFLPHFFKIPSYLFIILGILTSFFVIFRHLIFRHFEVIYFKDKDIKGESIYEGKGILPTLYKTVIKFLGIYSLAQPLLIISIIFNFLGIYIIFYFLAHALSMLGNVFFLILKAIKIKD